MCCIQYYHTGAVVFEEFDIILVGNIQCGRIPGQEQGLAFQRPLSSNVRL